MRKLAILLLAIVVLAGCKDPYGACEKAALNIGNGVAAGMKTTDDLRAAGKISVQEETNILGFLKFANDANGAFGNCAQQVHASGARTGYTACASVFQVALSNPSELVLIHVSNPNTQQDVTVIVNGINAGVSTLLAALGGQ